MKKHMEANEGGIWWDYKMKTRCLTCNAQADDTSVEETRKNHFEKRSRRDASRANAWKKTTDKGKLNWQLTDLEHYRKVTGDEGATDTENLGDPGPSVAKKGGGGKGSTCWPNS